MRPVLISAGGTGGHVYPGLAVAAALSRRGVSVHWLGALGGMEERLVTGHGLPFHGIRVRGLRGKGLGRWLLAPPGLLRALFDALRLLRRVKPSVVLCFGGYAAGPGGLAAWLLRLPLLVHEQNALAGWTNRLLGRLADLRLGAYPDALPRACTVGNPVRADIAALPPPALRAIGARRPWRLLVLGGSSGALALNRALPEALARLPEARRPEVRHQCGANWVEATRDAYAARGVQASVEPYFDDMAAAYLWADVAVCRAGALTLAELCAAGLGALLIPYPHAVDDHQTANARFLVARGAARLLPEAELDPERLADELLLLADPERQRAMAGSARACAVVDAAERIVDLALEAAR